MQATLDDLPFDVGLDRCPECGFRPCDVIDNDGSRLCLPCFLAEGREKPQEVRYNLTNDDAA